MHTGPVFKAISSLCLCHERLGHSLHMPVGDMAIEKEFADCVTRPRMLAYSHGSYYYTAVESDRVVRVDIKDCVKKLLAPKQHAKPA